MKDSTMYFDGRERKEPEGDELLNIPERKVDIDITELYTANSVSPQTQHTICVPDKYAYPRPPTVDMAREMYFNDEIDETQFELMVETALKIEGVNCGEPLEV